MRAIARLLVGALVLSGSAALAAFPGGFRWGVAIAGFQSDQGRTAGSTDPGTDWWAWSHDAANILAGRVSGDLVEQGPDFWTLFPKDIRLARTRLGLGTFRMSLEWSRLFHASTAAVDIGGGPTLADLQQLDALADPIAVDHYRRVFAELRRRRLEPMVTLVHFSLPLWIHDPIATRDALAGIDPSGPLPTGFGPAGWLDAATVTEFTKYAAWAAWKFGDLVDLWSPLNEPLVVATNGFVNAPGILTGNFPPGAFTFTGAVTAILNELAAHGAGYDMVKAWDVVDADGDGQGARVGPVHNMVAFHPANPASPLDVASAANADYIFNRVFLNGALLGDVDANVDGTIGPGEHHPELVGRADFIGVNYYLRAVAQGVGAPLTPVIPLLDFLPTITYANPENPTAPPCPTVCTEFGWEIHPQGLREVLAIAGGYGVPVFITENGLADGDDDQRLGYLVQHLSVLEQAIADGVADVRGYYHWSLTDNFEWSSGYFPRFGLYAYDPATARRRIRRSARDYKRIARRNAIPARLLP